MNEMQILERSTLNFQRIVVLLRTRSAPSAGLRVATCDEVAQTSHSTC